MNRSDADLLAAAAEGNADAFAVFFRRHVRAITAYAARRCDSPDDVADLVADTFMIALQASPRYLPETDTALPWLFGIARRVLTRQRRRRAGFQRLLYKNTHRDCAFFGIEEDAIANAIDAARHRPVLAAALERLSRGERAVLELVAFEGLSPGEAAVALDITANAARLKLSRARKRMRSILGSELPAIRPSHPEATGGL